MQRQSSQRQSSRPLSRFALVLSSVVCIAGLAMPHVAHAHGDQPHTPDSPEATPDVAIPILPGSEYRLYLPIVIAVGEHSAPIGPAETETPTPEPPTHDTQDSHEVNDYDLAAAARKRDEPPFVPDNSDILAPSALDNATLGEWSAPTTWPFVYATAAYLPDGRIVGWGGNNPTSFNGGTSTYAAIWDPATNQFTSKNHSDHSMFCAIPTMLEDGRVLVAGGDGTRERTSIFDYKTNNWTRMENMSTGRWYGGSALLPSGKVFMAAGDPGGRYPEVWTSGSGWALLTGADLQTAIISQTAYQNTWLPYVHVAPDGRIFHSGPTTVTNWINPTGNGSVSPAGLSNTWYPKYSAAIMYDEGKILVAGGAQGPYTQAATNQAKIFTVNGGTAQQVATTPMNNARKFHNGVVLPTGEVLLIGGNTSGVEFSDVGTILPAEIWNPTTQAWRTVASISVPRNYHSVALLMADGRVFSGGGGLCNCAADHPDHQIYSPGYLYNADGTLATRPLISSAPDAVGVGQSLSVQASPGVQRFTLVRMAAVTHNLNSDTRFLNVAFTGSGPYQLNLHSNVNVLIPGYWMLFALNAQGVPSLAKVIRVAATTAPVITNPGAQNNILGDAVSLQIQASDVNNDPLTYSASGLPAGLAINPNTGLMNGTVTALGSYNVSVNVSDGAVTSSVSLAWTVLPLSGNLAQGKPVTTSAIEAAQFGANLAVDGNATTRWSSTYSDPNWLQVDLGTTRSVTRVVLNWEAAYGKAYTIQVSSDATNWTNIYSTVNGDGGVDDLAGLNGTGRYVRVYGTQRGTQWGYSLWEFEVYGSAATLTLNPINALPKPVNTNINYTASSSGGVNPRYKWAWGDGSAETAYSASPNASHSYAAPGLYTLKLTATDDNTVEKTLTWVQAVHAPSTANKPSSSMNILVETRAAGNPRVWVVNQDNDSVSVFDAATNAKLAEVNVGAMPRSIALAPNGNVWVTNKGAATISIISPSTLAVVQTVNLPYASQPFGLAFAPTGGSAFVVLEASGTLLKLDANSGAQTGAISVGPNVRGVAVSADGASVLVSRFVTPKLPGEETATVSPSATAGGEVIVVNASAMTLARTVVLQHSDKPDTENQGSGIPNYVGAVAISPDGATAWAPSKQDNVKRGVLRNGSGLNFQSTVRAILSRIDLSAGSNTDDLAGRVDHDNSSVSSAAVFDRYGNYIFTALETSREVGVIDAYNKQEITRFGVGRAPQGLAVSADGLKLYVNNFMDRTVQVFDLSALMNRGEKTFALLATYNAVAAERLSAQVLNGKQLFYDAKDPRLARDSYMSCASCHNDGGQDGRVWDFTGFGEGLRNTVALRGRSGAQGFLHWSANFNEVQDFEAQIRNFAGGTGLMTDAQFNTGTRNTPLGDAKAGVSSDLDALAAYLASLNSFAASPFRNSDGTLTADATAGKALFASANCAQCHGGAAFSSSGSATLFNIGTLKPSSGQRLGAGLSGIDPPTLRDVWASGPYLHDGSAATLNAAVSAHNNQTLNATQVQQVVAYLQQIGSLEAAAPGPSLSQGKTATQSTIDFSGAASRAVDGNTNGVYTAGSTTHTANEANAWWQVDLGASYAISHVMLWNRADCCADRLANFYVFVSSTDLAGRSYSSILADGSVWRYQVAGQAPASLSVPVATSGRYVRVQLAGTGILSLAEVQVFEGAGVATCTLPSGWASQDIGSPGQAGSACESSGTWTVKGGGADIWGASDQFRFAYQSANAPTNATIVARVTAVQNTDSWAKSGVMFRDGTAANARFVMVVQMPSNEVALQWRDATGGSAAWSGARVGGTAGVKWLRLVKSGSTYTAHYSTATGVPTSGQWVQISTARTVTMTNPKPGLAVTAHNNASLNTSTFTGVAVTSP